MYYPDLSAYSYSKFDQKLKVRYGLSDDTQFLNIGWLDSTFPYEKGGTDKAFLEKLFERVKRADNMMRGFHNCPFCEDDTFIDPDYFMVLASVKGEKRHLGSMEIFAIHENTVFIAPNLVYHYIADHSYKPPAVFYDAVMAFGIGLSSDSKTIR